MELTKEQIKQGLDKAYKEAGHNAYFGNGFEAGVKFALEQVKKFNYDAVLATVLDDPNTVRLCKPNYLAKDGSIQPAKRFDDYKNEQHIYYCHKDDLYGG